MSERLSCDDQSFVTLQLKVDPRVYRIIYNLRLSIQRKWTSVAFPPAGLALSEYLLEQLDEVAAERCPPKYWPSGNRFRRSVDPNHPRPPGEALK